MCSVGVLVLLLFEGLVQKRFTKHEGKAVDVGNLGFRKVFHAISHSILLEKLPAYGSDRGPEKQGFMRRPVFLGIETS